MAEPAALNRLVQVRILVPQSKKHGIGRVFLYFMEKRFPILFS